MTNTNKSVASHNSRNYSVCVKIVWRQTKNSNNIEINRKLYPFIYVTVNVWHGANGKKCPFFANMTKISDNRWTFVVFFYSFCIELEKHMKTDNSTDLFALHQMAYKSSKSTVVMRLRWQRKSRQREAAAATAPPTTTLKHFWNSFTQFSGAFRLCIWLHSDVLLLHNCATNSIRLESLRCQLLLQRHLSPHRTGNSEEWRRARQRWNKTKKLQQTQTHCKHTFKMC